MFNMGDVTTVLCIATHVERPAVVITCDEDGQALLAVLEPLATPHGVVYEEHLLPKNPQASIPASPPTSYLPFVDTTGTVQSPVATTDFPEDPESAPLQPL